MDGRIAIRVDHISKVFKVYYDKGVYLKERVLFRQRGRYEERKVLNDISFNVKKGEAIGLIGENGCGKSTMLKLLSRIMYPDSGKVETFGRLSALIELGAGFHPDMSGRENIYTNAAIFGLTKAEIDSRLQTIIDFSELEEYIDNPVRTYSSGMYMRLAFSVAINVDADILLIDEILAVGDMAFQAKCFNKLREIKNRGTTIIIVSHSLGQIEQICDRSLWIEKGLIRLNGKPRDVHPHYMEYMMRKNKHEKPEEEMPETTEPADEERKEEAPHDSSKRYGSGEAKIEKAIVLDANGKERYFFSAHESFTVRIFYTAKSVLPNSVAGLAIFKADQTYYYGTNTLIESVPVTLLRNGLIDLVIDNLPVSNGEYIFDLALHRPDDMHYDFWRDVFRVTIADSIYTPGLINLSHHWEIR